MKHCHKCNLEFPQAYRFCGSCGGSLSDSLTCQGCGDLVESKWAFCTNCGKKVSVNGTSTTAFSADVPHQTKIPVTATLPPSRLSRQTQTAYRSDRQSTNDLNQEWYAAPDLFEEAGETTATPISPRDVTQPAVIAPQRATVPRQSGNGRAAPTLTMLSAYGEASITAQPEWQGRRPLLAAVVLLVFFGALGFGAVYWWTYRASAAQSSVAEATNDFPAGADSSTSSATPAPTERLDASTDNELKRLREKRISAKPSEANEIITSLEEAEKKYPNEYRFPYERAKLSIKGIVSHGETFEALSVAAVKAIDSGKAQEMLDSLMADKEGDFWKPSHGHHEWDVLVKALSNKDKKSLTELHH